MNGRRILPLTTDVFVRVAADAIMVTAAFWLAMTIRYVWIVGDPSVGTSVRAKFLPYLLDCAPALFALTFISVIAFALSGFYTHGRAYRGRYKALMVFQAVTVSYLAVGSLSYVVSSLISVPRTTLPLAWALTSAFLVGARLWSTLWKAMAQAESRFSVPPSERHIKNVLVIGGDGYIGSALLPKLLARGYRVRVLSLFLYGTDPIEKLLGHPRLEVVKADFRQIDKVVEAMRDTDAVVHLGAIVGDPACALDENLTIDVNFMATRMIAEVAKGHGVNRFVFASTCSVYGASEELLDEHSALCPVSLYAKTKIACERVLGQMADNGFAPVVLRFGTVYGLSGRTRFDLVVNLLTALGLVEGEITVIGGEQWRPFVHVDDAALCLVKALEAPLDLVNGQVYNVGSDNQNYTIAQLGDIIHQLIPTAVLSTRPSGGDRRNYRVSFSKIRKELHFTPAWTIEQGVKQVIEAIQSGRVKDYRDARYSNYKFLSEEGLHQLTHRGASSVWELVQDYQPEPLKSRESEDQASPFLQSAS
jgi:nucleoside-diphosphate-sugar epimerase